MWSIWCCEADNDLKSSTWFDLSKYYPGLLSDVEWKLYNDLQWYTWYTFLQVDAIRSYKILILKPLQVLGCSRAVRFLGGVATWCLCLYLLREGSVLKSGISYIVFHDISILFWMDIDDRMYIACLRHVHLHIKYCTVLIPWSMADFAHPQLSEVLQDRVSFIWMSEGEVKLSTTRIYLQAFLKWRQQWHSAVLNWRISLNDSNRFPGSEVGTLESKYMVFSVSNLVQICYMKAIEMMHSHQRWQPR